MGGAKNPETVLPLSKRLIDANATLYDRAIQTYDSEMLLREYTGAVWF